MRRDLSTRHLRRAESFAELMRLGAVLADQIFERMRTLRAQTPVVPGVTARR